MSTRVHKHDRYLVFFTAEPSFDRFRTLSRAEGQRTLREKPHP